MFSLLQSAILQYSVCSTVQVTRCRSACGTVLNTSRCKVVILSWVMQVAQRHFNAHAFVNAAIFLDLEKTGSDGHTSLQVQEAHVVFGFDQQTGAACSCTHLLCCLHALVIISVSTQQMLEANGSCISQRTPASLHCLALRERLQRSRLAASECDSRCVHQPFLAMPSPTH